MVAAFTPNVDGHKDVFRPLQDANITRVHMTIYSRWGQQVFETTDIAKGWDGRINGVRQPQGVYVWVIVYDTPVSKSRTLKGTLALVY